MHCSSSPLYSGGWGLVRWTINYCTSVVMARDCALSSSDKCFVEAARRLAEIMQVQVVVQ